MDVNPRREFLRFLAYSPLIGYFATGVANALEEKLPGTAGDAINVFQLEPVARGKLPKPVYDFIAGGSDDEKTMRANREAFDRLQLRVRRLVDVSNVDTSVRLFGETHETPIILAPVGLQRPMHPEGELASARGATSRRREQPRDYRMPAGSSGSGSRSAPGSDRWWIPPRNRHLQGLGTGRRRAWGWGATRAGLMPGPVRLARRRDIRGPNVKALWDARGCRAVPARHPCGDRTCTRYRSAPSRPRRPHSRSKHTRRRNSRESLEGCGPPGQSKPPGPDRKRVRIFRAGPERGGGASPPGVDREVLRVALLRLESSRCIFVPRAWSASDPWRCLGAPGFCARSPRGA